MRVKTKNNIEKILEKLLLICDFYLKKGKEAELSILEDIHQALYGIKVALLKEIEADDPCIINLIEGIDYISLNKNSNSLDFWIELRTIIENVRENLSKQKAQYQIVFFPYKAEMWDSLESIWLACKDDPRCDCKVVPIPYYQLDTKEDLKESFYEIDKFPSYLPVIDYRNYSLEERPEVAFIHNPYDEYNNLINVYSDYFSYNIKKYVDKLFYVPYYVTSGFIADNQRLLSAYCNADYLIVQSDKFKAGLDEKHAREKALVMGSPKLDRVIRMSGKSNPIPKEWKMNWSDKKSVMLNTSIGQFLLDAEAYLRKLKYVFECIERRNDIVLIWRPHPLLESTIESLRPMLLSNFTELKQYYVDHRIGIIDSTADVVNTVAIADAYIGEISSSVVNLYEAAGKPVFVLNNYIDSPMSKEQKLLTQIGATLSFSDESYAILYGLNGLFKIDYSRKEIQLVHTIEGQARWVMQNRAVLEYGNDIYLSSWGSSSILKYNIEKNVMEVLWEEPNGNRTFFINILEYENKICFVPVKEKGFVIYDIKTKKVKEDVEPVNQLIKDIHEELVEDIFQSAIDNNYIWAVHLYSNRVLRYDIKTGKYVIYEIGDKDNTYCAIEVFDEMVWLAEAKSGRIIEWNKNTQEITSFYNAPKGFVCFADALSRYISYHKLIRIQNYLLAIPFLGNGLVKINLETKKVMLIEAPLGDEVMGNHNNYYPSDYGVALYLGLKDKDVVRIQRTWDKAVIELNIMTEEYEEYNLSLEEEMIQKRLEESDGFEKSHCDLPFVRQESPYYTLDGFLDDLVNENLEDAMKRQLQEMQTMAVNLDGTCGEKVHEFMMNVLDEEMA